jgi:nicotinate-nucleotide--dimethylbenzimidazole phosphoribosyltransferase
MSTAAMDLEKIIRTIQPMDQDWANQAENRTGQLVMPHRAMGRLHDFSEKLCGIQKTLSPSISRKAVLIMAGDHGVAEENTSAYPREVTGAMVQTFLKNGAGINAVAGHVNAEVWVVDMGIIPELQPEAIAGANRLIIRKIAKGTQNFTQGPAMSAQEAETAVLTGFALASDLFAQGIDLLGTGDMGIGNTTPSAAIGAVIAGCSVEQMTGRGTGIDDEGLQRKCRAITTGIKINRPDPLSGLDVLAKVGGFEIGGIAGSILAGAYHQKPVVIDGFISTAGALIAHALCPKVSDYLFAGHCSVEPGHRLMLTHLGLTPILNLGMRLGEGTGAALAMSILEASVRVFTDVMTFEEAGVPSD